MAEHRSHGKERMRWCDSCGTLLLGQRCSACGGEGRAFELNSPGDIRPAMEDGSALVLSLFEEAFGDASPLRGRQLFFNKVAGEDRSDEVVAGGAVIATLRWNLLERRYRLELRAEGASLIAPHASSNVLRCGRLGGHVKGRNLSGDVIREAAGDFVEGDPLIVISGGTVAAGTARAPADRIMQERKAFKVKDVASCEFDLGPPSGRGEFVAANREHLRKLEMAAVSDLRSIVKGKNRAVTASFSGGKDSLAAYLLAERALAPIDLIFVNTGLEFPETVEYVRRFASERSSVLHELDAGDAFWRSVGHFGPPAKDFRWCCKSCKLAPLTEGISLLYPKGTMTVEGNRSLESFSRADTRFVARNPFVPNQTVLNPIRAWNAAEVWAYIWSQGEDYNPLYERDYSRIGCYLCPSSLGSDWERTAELHPELHRGWDRHLRSYANEKGLPPEYVDHGFWRWKAHPPKMLRLAEGLDLKLTPHDAESVSLRMLKGASPCAAGGHSAEAVLELPLRRELSMMSHSLRTIGEVRYSEEFDIALLRYKGGSAKVFAGGQISVVAPKKELAEELFDLTVKALIRYQMCNECGICAKGCPRGAITIDGGLRVSDQCDRCGRCLNSCVAVHYHDRILA